MLELGSMPVVTTMAKEASPEATKEKGAVEAKSEEAKETTFVSPTEEEIKQLCQPEKAGEAKKKE